MGLYSKIGYYSGYKKSHKDREVDDYYATPPKEVYNILRQLNLDFAGQIILDPCSGGGHMLEGIEQYCIEKNIDCQIIGTDKYNHPKLHSHYETTIKNGDEYDFLKNEYPCTEVDYIVLNPPFTHTIEFVTRSLDIAQKGLIMLNRLKALEGKARYESIFSICPPSEVWVYVDRVGCWKNGVKTTGSSVEAYAWFIWLNDKKVEEPVLKWIKRCE